jgi:hypothetical protein
MARIARSAVATAVALALTLAAPAAASARDTGHGHKTKSTASHPAAHAKHRATTHPTKKPARSNPAQARDGHAALAVLHLGGGSIRVRVQANGMVVVLSGGSGVIDTSIGSGTAKGQQRDSGHEKSGRPHPALADIATGLTVGGRAGTARNAAPTAALPAAMPPVPAAPHQVQRSVVVTKPSNPVAAVTPPAPAAATKPPLTTQRGTSAADRLPFGATATETRRASLLLLSVVAFFGLALTGMVVGAGHRGRRTAR